MRILVIGGTGKVGRALVEELARRDVEVRALSRSGGPAGRPGVEGIRGDMSRPDTLAAAFAGVERCYPPHPARPDETEMGLNALDAARAAGVERIVFQSVSHADDYPMIPHFASKVRILDRIRESGVPWAAIFPSSFYQNDIALRDLILGPGFYPNPIGSGGINRVDVRDIAAVAAAALLEPGFESREVPAVGPDTWTGDSIAAVSPDLLGRVDPLSGTTSRHGPPAPELPAQWLVHDLALMFEQFQDAGLSASPRSSPRLASCSAASRARSSSRRTSWPAREMAGLPLRASFRSMTPPIASSARDPGPSSRGLDPLRGDARQPAGDIRPRVPGSLADPDRWSAGMAGLAVSVYGLGGLVASLAGGWLADRFGRRRTIAASMFSSAAVVLSLTPAASPRS
jgi:uncharacterized protein YbjT (DUF2867 family)